MYYQLSHDEWRSCTLNLSDYEDDDVIWRYGRDIQRIPYLELAAITHRIAERRIMLAKGAFDDQ